MYLPCVATGFLSLGLAKGFAFRYLVKPSDSGIKIAVCVSCCMVIPMVVIMSLYGAVEAAVSQGVWGSDPRDLAYEYSKKLYNGTAAADVDCRTVGAQGVPYPVPGRNGAGIRSGPADIIPYDVGRAFIL